MNDYIEASIVGLYDEHVQTLGDEGVKVADAKAAIRVEVRSLVAATERDVDRETDTLIASVLSSARQKRSRSLKKNLEYLLDAVQDPESAAFVEPMLGQAFSLGDEHGVDKVLRNWTGPDFQRLTVTRYRVAAEATAAAVEFDHAVDSVVERMQVAGVVHVGDVDWVAS